MSLIDNELKHSREDFIIHFNTTYSDPYPPAWILAEILPFGIVTNIFCNLKNKKIKKRASQPRFYSHHREAEILIIL